MWHTWGGGTMLLASIITVMDNYVLAHLTTIYEMGHATVTRRQLRVRMGAAYAPARLGVHWGRSTSTHCKHVRRSYQRRTRWAARRWTLNLNLGTFLQDDAQVMPVTWAARRRTLI